MAARVEKMLALPMSKAGGADTVFAISKHRTTVLWGGGEYGSWPAITVMPQFDLMT